MKQTMLAVWVGLFAVSALAQTQQTNLIARWAFDAGKGTNVVDGSGNGWNGVLEGMPLPGWTNGVSGFGVSFDGIQNQMIVFSPQSAVLSQGNGVFSPQSSVLSFTNSGLGTLDYGQGLTVAAWVRAAAGVTGEIIAKWSTNGTAQGSFMLSLTNGMPRFELRLNSRTGVPPVSSGTTTNQTGGTPVPLSTYHCVVGTSGRTDGAWHLVAGTYDGKQMAVWWDGRLDGVIAVTGSIESVDAPVLIGLVNAVVDEVALYGRALAAEEMEGEWRKESGVRSQESGVGGQQAAESSLYPVASSQGMTAGITFPYENPLVPSDATLRGVLAGLTTMQIGAPGTQPSVPPGGYAERRAREMEILNAAISRLRPEENPCAALRVALAGLTTMHVGAPGTRPTVPPGGYAERRARELEAIHAAVSSHAPEDRSGAALRAALAGLTTTQVGAPNTRPVVPPGGYAERRAAEMEAIDAAMFDSGRR